LKKPIKKYVLSVPIWADNSMNEMIDDEWIIIIKNIQVYKYRIYIVCLLLQLSLPIKKFYEWKD